MSNSTRLGETSSGRFSNNGDSAGNRKIWTAAEIRAMPKDRADAYVVYGMNRKGWVTLTAAREKIGKNTLHMAKVKACESGGLLLGRRTQPAKFLLFTEEPPDVLQEKLNDFDIHDLRIVFMWDVKGTWAEKVDYLTNQVVNMDYDGLIIDNFQRASGVREENSPELGEAADVFSNAVREAEIVGDLVHHFSKAGTIRGHTSLTANTEVNLTIARYTDSDKTDPRRVFECEGKKKAAFWDSVGMLEPPEYRHLGTILEYQGIAKTERNLSKVEYVANKLRAQGKAGEFGTKDVMAIESCTDREAQRQVKDMEAAKAAKQEVASKGNIPAKYSLI